MLIRSFEPRDLTRLIELTIETFQPFYENSFRPLVGEVVFAIQHGTWREDYHTFVADLHDPEQHKHVAVAEAESEIAGYTGWSIDPGRGHARLEILAVTADQRRSGLGTMLCDHAFAHMRTNGAAMVEIGTGGDEFHAPARALYEGLGCIKLPTAAYLREL